MLKNQADSHGPTSEPIDGPADRSTDSEPTDSEPTDSEPIDEPTDYRRYFSDEFDVQLAETIDAVKKLISVAEKHHKIVPAAVPPALDAMQECLTGSTQFRGKRTRPDVVQQMPGQEMFDFSSSKLIDESRTGETLLPIHLG